MNITSAAQNDYRMKQLEIEELVKKIRTGLKAHSKSEKTNPLSWGYSGDLGYVLEELKNVSDFLNGEGEYA